MIRMIPTGEKSPGTEDSNDVWLSDDTGGIGYDYGIDWDGGESYGQRSPATGNDYYACIIIANGIIDVYKDFSVNGSYGI